MRPVDVGGDQAALDAVDDDLVQLAEVGHLLRRLLQPLARAVQALRQVGADEGHGGAGHAGHEDRVHEVLDGQDRHVGQALHGDPARAHRPQHARRRRGWPPPARTSARSPVEQHAAGEHGDRVQQHEPGAGARAAGQVDEAGDDEQVDDDLHVHLGTAR